MSAIIVSIIFICSTTINSNNNIILFVDPMLFPSGNPFKCHAMKRFCIYSL